MDYDYSIVLFRGDVHSLSTHLPQLGLIETKSSGSTDYMTFDVLWMSHTITLRMCYAIKLLLGFDFKLCVHIMTVCMMLHWMHDHDLFNRFRVTKILSTGGLGQDPYWISCYPLSEPFSAVSSCFFCSQTLHPPDPPLTPGLIAKSWAMKHCQSLCQRFGNLLKITSERWG